MKHKLIISNGWGDTDMMCIDLTEEEEKGLSEVTAAMLYEHMKRHSVGVITPIGKTKFIERFKIGRISVSLQIAYYVWSEREEQGISQDMPITEQEFDDHCRGWIDVCVAFDGQNIMPPQQLMLAMMAECLVELGTKTEISW